MKQITDYTIDELKVMAYDEISRINVADNNLKIINARIAELSKTPEVTPPQNDKEK